MIRARFAFAAAAFVAAALASSSAWADTIAVLPFTGASGVTKPELDQARQWTREAVTSRGGTLPTDQQMISAERAVADGSPDTSAEYLAAGRAAGAEWTVTASVARQDVPPVKTADGGEEEGYTVYHLEVTACQIDSGRVESLVRDVDPDDAPAEISEMLALLLRPQGLANADIPWANKPHVRKVRPKPAPPPPPPPPPAPPPPPPKPVVRHAYAEGHPFAIGASVGFTDTLVRPSEARGPSAAMPIGGVLAYAISAMPGLEARGVFTSQVLGPRALEIAAGARYAFPVLPQYRIFAGPELLLGAHVALGADKTARFLAHGSAFVSFGLGEHVALEAAGDIEPAFGGSGTLLLAGGTGRVLVRF